MTQQRTRMNRWASERASKWNNSRRNRITIMHFHVYKWVNKCTDNFNKNVTHTNKSNNLLWCQWSLCNPAHKNKNEQNGVSEWNHLYIIYLYLSIGMASTTCIFKSSDTVSVSTYFDIIFNCKIVFMRVAQSENLWILAVGLLF